MCLVLIVAVALCDDGTKMDAVKRKFVELKQKIMSARPKGMFWKNRVAEGNAEEMAREFAEAKERHRMRFGGAPQDIMHNPRNRRAPLNDESELQHKLAEDDEADPMPDNAKNEQEQRELLGWKGESSLSQAPKQTITSVSRRSCRGRERADIAISVRPSVTSGAAFCKFGDTVVKGRITNDHLLHCKAPEHEPGVVRLSVSFDGRHFFGSVRFEFTKDSLINWDYIFVPFGIAIMVIILLIVFALCSDTKPTKRHRRKRKPASISQKEPRSHASVTRRNPTAFL